MQINDLSIKLLVLTLVLTLLPSSPFVGFNYLINQIPFLGYLNWFLPIPEIIVIMETWLAVVAIFYSILYLLNYVGVLKS